MATTTSRAQSPFETPPVLMTPDLAPTSLLSGPRYRVDDRVPTTGLLGEFTLQSDELATIEQIDNTTVQ